VYIHFPRLNLLFIEQHEDPDELEGPASGLKSVPISPTASATTRHASKSGWYGTIAGFIGLTKKSASGEPQDLQTAKDRADAERDHTITESPTGEGRTLPTLEPSTPRAQPAMANPSALKFPNKAPGSLANLRKRKRVPRADLYEIEASSHGSGPEEDLTNRGTKRPQHSIKAKPPLTKPKTSKDNTSSHHNLQPRASNDPDSREMETADGPASSTVSGENALKPIDGEQLRPAAKRGRGRPKKIPHQEPVHASDLTTSKKGFAIKVIREENPLVAAAGKIRKVANPTVQSVEIVNGRTSVEDEEGSSVEENQYVSDETEVVVPEQDVANSSLSVSRTSPIHKELLKRLLVRAGHVGQNFNAKQARLRQKKEKLCSGPGKRMNRQLEAISASYKALQSLKIARDQGPFREEHKKFEEAFSSLRHEADDVLFSGFSTDADTTEKTDLLTDLYFHTLPQIILAIQNAVQIYDNEGSMETPDLQEISDLVKLLYDLASSAVQQPKEAQPKPKSKNHTYQISQPTRSNLPGIRSLEKMISVELRSRERAKELAEEERLRPERERRHREQQKREEADLRRKREERRRMQGKDWWDLQNDYFPEPWNQILQANIANLEAKSSSWRQETAARKGKGRQESVELGYAGTYGAEPRHDGEDVERVSMFPENNINEVSRLDSLTKEDMSIFIDCMRYEQGKCDRNQK
jgi:hypothetical protein